MDGIWWNCGKTNNKITKTKMFVHVCSGNWTAKKKQIYCICELWRVYQGCGIQASHMWAADILCVWSIKYCYFVHLFIPTFGWIIHSLCAQYQCQSYFELNDDQKRSATRAHHTSIFGKRANFTKSIFFSFNFSFAAQHQYKMWKKVCLRIKQYLIKFHLISFFFLSH